MHLTHSSPSPFISIPAPNDRVERSKNGRRWFTVNMGTGIVSILLHNLPYNGVWLHWISVIIFALNVLLFVLFLSISMVRYLVYPGLWTAMIHHPVVPLFLGAFPIGLATIVEMIVLVCVPAWGHWAITLVGESGLATSPEFLLTYRGRRGRCGGSTRLYPLQSATICLS
jgi:tellurite resistance protein TehA-like permease